MTDPTKGGDSSPSYQAKPQWFGQTLALMSGAGHSLGDVVRHDIWRRVEFDHRQLTSRAPEGYEVVVEVYVAGREHPIELGWVETHRDPDDPWVRFQQHNRAFEDAEPDGRHPGDRWVHVHESMILRVEISYAQTGERPRGFDWNVAESGEPEPPSAG